MMDKTRKLLLAGAWLGVTGFAGNTAVVLESKMSLSQYASAYGSWAVSHIKAKGQISVSLVLPSMDIYNASGVLIYHGEKVESDVGVLENLPQRAQGLHTTAIRPDLRDALEMLPQIAKDKPAILASGRYSVVSITSSTGCRKCALQDAAIAKLKRLTSPANVNVLEVRLQ